MENTLPVTGQPMVMVINDDITQLSMLSSILEKQGYAVEATISAEDALGRIAEGHMPKVIVTDIQMPGIDGWQFCKLVRSHTEPQVRSTPILAVSAVFDGERPEMILAELGANAFLRVPYSRDELLDKVALLGAGKSGPLKRSRILVVVDTVTQAVPFSNALPTAYLEILTRKSIDEIVDRADSRKHGMVIIRENPPEIDAVRIIERLRASGYSNACIAVSATKSRAAQLLRAGADDCIVGEIEDEHLAAVCDKTRFEQAFRDVKDVLDARTWDLQESRERYRLMMDSMVDSVYIVSPEYRIEYMNAAATATLGKDHCGDVCHKVLFKLESPCQWCRLPEVLLGRELRFDFETGKRGGSFHCTAGPLEHPDGTRSYMAILRDTTRERHLERQLRQAERMEALGHLAGGIAHDFNNMLGAIIGYSELIDSTNNASGPDSVLSKRIGIVRSAAERASKLVSRLLAYSRQGKYESVAVPMHDTIEDVVSILAHSLNKNIKISSALSAMISVVEGDSAQLQSMLLNIAVNARDAMPMGGTLKIETCDLIVGTGQELEDQGTITPGSYLSIKITDSGIGMDDELQRKIFDPFFTTKEVGKGTGLGLASVYGTVKNHGGYVFVQSTVGKGSTFTVLLPVSGKSSVVESVSPLALDEIRSEGEFLIIDDEELVRDATREMLDLMGLKARAFEGAGKAFEYLQESKSVPAMVIIDMIMPEINGIEAWRRIKSLVGAVPVLLITGYTLEADAQEARSEGISCMLQKPFSRSELQRAIVDAARSCWDKGPNE